MWLYHFASSNTPKRCDQFCWSSRPGKMKAKWRLVRPPPPPTSSALFVFFFCCWCCKLMVGVLFSSSLPPLWAEDNNSHFSPNLHPDHPPWQTFNFSPSYKKSARIDINLKKVLQKLIHFLCVCFAKQEKIPPACQVCGWPPKKGWKSRA